MTVIGTCQVFRPEPRSLENPEQDHCAKFRAQHVTPSTVLITVEGEIDATNCRALARYIEGQLVGANHLILDLRHVDFFGTAGFAALHNINAVCGNSGVAWVLQAGRVVRRLLHICDPDRALPIEELLAADR